MEKEKHDHCCDSHSNQNQVIQVNDLQNSITSTFSVSGMDCADEIAAIQKALTHPKIGRIQSNLLSSQIIVEHDPSLTKEEVIKLINSSGVQVRTSNHSLSFYSENKFRVWLVIVSGLLLGSGLAIQNLFTISENILLGIYLVSTLASGSLIFPKALRAVKQKALDMNVLMTFAVTGAFFIGEYSEGAAVVFLFSLAEMLEAFSVTRARKAIREVLSITPQTATVEVDGQKQAFNVEKIVPGQTIIILAGERVPLDGVVLSGQSSVNQAPLTGESQPVLKSPGDTVLAGTINESGTLKVKVTHGFQETKISSVIRLIEEAQGKKAPAQLFVDKFSRIYTPVVTLIAVLVAIIPPLVFNAEWNPWFYKSLVFLVIACPCALVIATPVSIVSALTALAKAGVLVKGGVFLESLGKLRALAVDKTGTITEGRPRVVSMKLLKPEKQSEFLNVVYSLESNSTHPLARAALEFCKDKNATLKNISDFQIVQGQGIEGKIEGHHYFAGNHKLVHSLGICTPEIESYLSQLENEAQSVLVAGHMPHDGCSGEILGILGLADEPRTNAVQAIQNLHRTGIEKVAILSGDNQKTVNSIAKRVGIDSAVGDLLPEDKVNEIQKMLDSHQFVGMVGDGINDAPALARATLGIAMGAAGTDAAIETADVALMTDDLAQLAPAISHGRKTLRIIRFNIGFALATKLVFLVLGALGYSSLWLAVAADMGATLLVIANSLRLLTLNTNKSEDMPSSTSH